MIAQNIQRTQEVRVGVPYQLQQLAPGSYMQVRRTYYDTLVLEVSVKLPEVFGSAFQTVAIVEDMSKQRIGEQAKFMSWMPKPVLMDLVRHCLSSAQLTALNVEAPDGRDSGTHLRPSRTEAL